MAPVQRVVGGIFVKFTERRIVKTGVDEQLAGRFPHQGGEPDMNDFRGDLADHMDPQQFHGAGAVARVFINQFQKSVKVPHDHTAGILAVAGPADHIGNFVPSAGFFGPAGTGALGNGVNTQRQKGDNQLFRKALGGPLGQEATATFRPVILLGVSRRSPHANIEHGCHLSWNSGGGNALWTTIAAPFLRELPHIRAGMVVRHPDFRRRVCVLTSNQSGATVVSYNSFGKVTAS